jgi:hypothetical protein
VNDAFEEGVEGWGVGTYAEVLNQPSACANSVRRGSCIAMGVAGVGGGMGHLHEVREVDSVAKLHGCRHAEEHILKIVPRVISVINLG